VGLFCLATAVIHDCDDNARPYLPLACRGTRAAQALTQTSPSCAARRSLESGIGRQYTATATASRDRNLTSLFFSKNSQALSTTLSRRKLTIGHDEPRHDVALGAWTVPPYTHGLALRGCGSEPEQHNETRSVTRSGRNQPSLERLRICARQTSTALPKRNPQWPRRTNKECLPYPARLSRGTDHPVGFGHPSC
jgi:hypothetical protein